MSRYNNILQTNITASPGPLPQHEAICYEDDPRPELKADHELWIRVLTNARELDEELYYILQYIRREGGGLQRTKTGYKLAPGLWLHSDWERVKVEMLTPLKDKLIQLFGLCQMGVALSGEYVFPTQSTASNEPRQEVLFSD